MKKIPSIVFVCVGNACRSQMAEGFARAIAGDKLDIWSAGSRPAGFVLREAVASMKELGIDISRHHSKGIADLPYEKFDFVFTMGCDDECPLVPAVKREDWQIPDPTGSSPEYLRQVRDLIRNKVVALLGSIGYK